MKKILLITVLVIVIILIAEIHSLSKNLNSTSSVRSVVISEEDYHKMKRLYEARKKLEKK